MTNLKNCPSCGRPIKFDEKYAKIIACSYCNSILEFGEQELSKIGEQAEFINFPSQFVIGKEIKWKGKNINVKGELRYEYDGGFFSEFFIEIEGKTYYLIEDDGQQKLIKNGNWQDSSTSLLDKPVGEKNIINGLNIFIQESGIFSLIGMKGFIDTKLIPGKVYEYIDGILNGNMIYIEKIIGENKIRINKEIKI